MPSGERWADVPGWAGDYQASTHGRVRSSDVRVRANTVSPCAIRRGRILTPAVKQSSGYRQVTLARGCRRQGILLHSLIALVFLGPKPEGTQVRHLDGDRGNNSVGNLAYGTAKENAADRDHHGHTVRGARWHQVHKK